MRGWINEIDLGDFLATIPVQVAVDTADVHQAGQPSPVHLMPSAPVTRLVASLTWVGGPTEPASPSQTFELSPGDGPTYVEFLPKDPGVYRLHVDGDEIEPASDLFTLAPA